MKTLSLVVLALLLALVGCQATVPANNPGADVSYIRDTRTGLCFAGVASIVYGGYQVVSIANVPCTPEVEKLLEKK